VATGLTGAEEAYRDIDYNTLTFLFGMMALKCLLAKHKYSRLLLCAGCVWWVVRVAQRRDGAVGYRFAIYLRRLLLWGRPSWRALLVRVGCLSAVLAPLITNDATCVFLTPIVEEIAIRSSLSLFTLVIPYVDSPTTHNPSFMSHSFKYPMLPLMLAICTCANIGSSVSMDSLTR
jgi:Na+/H+ antiporter NhaD/arsenite permease-like protein